MDYLLIDSYDVAALTGYSSVPQLFLHVKPTDQEVTSTRIILLNFQANDPPSPNFIDLGEPFQVFLPLRDFVDIYHILQTESPAYIQIEGVQAGVGVRIGTFDEPLGEGPRDRSA